MSKLFSPIKIGPLQLDNRIVIAPMCMFSAHDGVATDWHLMHLGSLSLSGAGLLIIESTAVSPEGRITHADLGLWSEDSEVALARILRFVKQHSPIRIGIQLSHAGRKASSSLTVRNGNVPSDDPHGWQTLAPSAIPFDDGLPPSKELNTIDIKRIVNDFATAAARAVSAGVDQIELHGAHGFLIHEFLSPLSNHRTDEYGESPENRMRFALEVFDAVKAAVPAHIAVGIRISGEDWVEGGWDLEQSIALAKALQAKGCAYIHVSGGGLDPHQQIPTLDPGYQLPMAEAIKKEIDIPVIGVGLITTPQEAETALQENKADLIALGRAILYNPRWGWHAAAALGEHSVAPVQYAGSAPHNAKSLFKNQ